MAVGQPLPTMGLILIIALYAWSPLSMMKMYHGRDNSLNVSMCTTLIVYLHGWPGDKAIALAVGETISHCRRKVE